MRATGRPNEVVSLRSIVIPQFRSVLPFWGLGSGSDLLLWGCTSAAGLKQQHDLICGVVSFDPNVGLSHVLRRAVSFAFSSRRALRK